VVASRFPGLELLFLKHGLGGLCDPESPADIARAILALDGRGQAARKATRLRLRRVFESELCFDRGAGLLEGAARRLLEAA